MNREKKFFYYGFARLQTTSLHCCTYGLLGGQSNSHQVLYVQNRLPDKKSQTELLCLCFKNPYKILHFSAVLVSIWQTQFQSGSIHLETIRFQTVSRSDIYFNATNGNVLLSEWKPKKKKQRRMLNEVCIPNLYEAPISLRFKSYIQNLRVFLDRNVNQVSLEFHSCGIQTVRLLVKFLHLLQQVMVPYWTFLLVDMETNISTFATAGDGPLLDLSFGRHGN